VRTGAIAKIRNIRGSCWFFDHDEHVHLLRSGLLSYAVAYEAYVSALSQGSASRARHTVPWVHRDVLALAGHPTQLSGAWWILLFFGTRCLPGASSSSSSYATDEGDEHLKRPLRIRDPVNGSW